MTRLRRRPREVYRVYTEEEYLNGAGLESAVALADEWPVAVKPVRRGVVVNERRLRRVAGAAMLAGAVGAVGGVVAANDPWASQGAGRRPWSLVAETETHASRIVRSPVTSWPAVAHRPEATRARVARVAGRRMVADTYLRTEPRGGSDTHYPEHARQGRSSDLHPSTAAVGARRGEGAAIVVDYSPGVPEDGSAATSSTDGGMAAASSTDEATVPAATAGVATARAGAGTQAEFGFER